MGKIILGSSSPRRASILKTMKLDFDVIPSEYDEPHTQAVFSYKFVESLAYNKALDVAKKLNVKTEIQNDCLQEFIKDDSYIFTHKNGRYIDNCI